MQSQERNRTEQRKPSPVQSNTLTPTGNLASHSLNLHVLRFCQETEAPWGTPRRHEENMQTPHRKRPLSDSNPWSRCETTVLTIPCRVPTSLMTSMEPWLAAVPPSPSWNLRVGMDWAVWGVAWTNITLSSEPTIPQLFATLTAVKMLSPGCRTIKQVSYAHTCKFFFLNTNRQICLAAVNTNANISHQWPWHCEGVPVSACW